MIRKNGQNHEQILGSQASLLERLARQAEELSRNNLELEQFTYISSHNLKEPLRKIATFSQLLSERYKDHLDAEGERYVNFVSQSVRTMEGLIDGLLEYSRVANSIKRSTFINLEEIVNPVLADMEPLISERKVEVVIGSLPSVMVEPAQIRQIFRNLIGNAVKFCEEKIPRVEIYSEPRENDWIIAVRDNAIGIDQKHWKNIFKVFHRLHTHAKHAGTGMGLPLSKKIIESYGGSIWVSSEPGSGSTFFFSLPKVA